MTSSQHGLYVQGYTRATMDGTEGSKTARWSKSSKPFSVLLQAPIRLHEAGIASNRGSATSR